MIQRIQSIYLLLTIILSILFLSGSIFLFADANGTEYQATVHGVSVITEGSPTGQVHNTLPLTVFVILTALFSAIAIFSFRNRKTQLKFSISVIVLSGMLILSSAYCIFYVISEFDARLRSGLKMIIPFLMLIFAILAYRGIKKDDILVKSYDRLR